MIITEAIKEDLKSIVELLLNDELGKLREKLETEVPEEYVAAFDHIEREPHNRVYVAKENGEVLGTFQLTFIQNLTYKGGLRAQIEGVRVHKTQRGKGLGKLMIQEAVRISKAKGAHIIQLTTDKQRPDAIEFYLGLGFKSSHEGMKLHLK